MRWVVTFAGSRDRYEVPLALAEADRLDTLVTDFYTPLDGRASDSLSNVDVESPFPSQMVLSMLCASLVCCIMFVVLIE